MDYIVFELSVIIISTATLCFIAELAKQPLIVAYIAAGFLVGPYGLNIIQANGFFTALSQVGIILLLYLIGLNLKPEKFAETIKRSYNIALFSTLCMIPLGILIGWLTGLATIETTYLTITMLFSSTVVVLKRMQDDRGVDPDVFDTCVGILLIQDIAAVLVLLGINSLISTGSLSILQVLRFLVMGFLFVASAFFIQRYALRRIIRRIIDRTDLIFLVGLAWCFLFAEIAELLNFSREIGGFIAGLSLTSLPKRKLHIFVSKSETIRDFFMILFFFLLGVNLRFENMQQYSLLIFLTLIVVLIIKPFLYTFFAKRNKHSQAESREIGARLGQNSEFSIIIALLAASAGQITSEFAMVIQLILFISIIISNYVVKYVRVETKV